MDLLLQTKLVAPLVRDRLVRRSRLVQRLEDGLLDDGKFQRRLTLVTAPAGYGKTTLVAGWLHEMGSPFAWLSLDPSDNDPARFLAYLVAAVQSLGAGSAAHRAMQSPQIPPVEAVVSILLNEIAAYPRPFILVMDDYHVIHSAQIHQAVTFFLEHQPANAHLVLVTREDPLLPVPRLRARGQALEIRQDDLRFSTLESSQFIYDVMKLTLSKEDMATLNQRTEGWVAGLQLAGLAMQGLAHQGSAEISRFIRAFAGSSRFVIDYLVNEVFRQQPESIQEFLLKTSILERLTPSLCDDLTGRPGSRELLEYLDQANLFMVPLDQDREWYRYHHLFAEFLRHHLRVQFPSMLPDLHRSASRWYDAHGHPAGAVEHALSAEDWGLAGDIIDRSKDAMLRRGEIYTLLTWYRRLPEALVRSKVELALGYAWPLVLSGQFDLVETLLVSVEPLIEGGTIEQGNLFAVRAFLARSTGDHAATIKFSEQALALLEKTNPAVRGPLAVNLGIAYWHSGLLDETEQIMGEVEHVGSQTGNPYVVLTARFFLARTLATRGALKRAEHLFRQLIQGGGQSPIVALVHFDLATLYLEWNRLSEAEDHLGQGMEISAQTGNAEFLSSGHILRAFLHLGRRRVAAACEEADRAYELAREYSPGTRARSEALQALVSLAAGNLAQAEAWAGRMQSGADAHPLYRFLDLTRPRLLLAQGKKDEAEALLADCCVESRRRGWGYGLVAALVLRSLTAGMRKDALTYLGEALRLAEPEGFLRTFLDAGPGLAPILREAAQQGLHPAYAGQILAEMPAADRHEKPGLAEPLSERELEVLRLVAAGLSNREIAHVLVVTPGTAKTHIHHICGKLGVRNRTEAAVRARELDLI